MEAKYFLKFVIHIVSYAKTSKELPTVVLLGIALCISLSAPNYCKNYGVTVISLFNVYVKSVLLYGCQTWLVTYEIQRKLQSFINRSLRYMMKIWWPRVISSEKLWKMTGQVNIIRR
jgi:hypothetical protein